jgi:hypothetical protein
VAHADARAREDDVALILATITRTADGCPPPAHDQR